MISEKFLYKNTDLIEVYSYLIYSYYNNEFFKTYTK